MAIDKPAVTYTTPIKRARKKGSITTKIRNALNDVLATPKPECLLTRTSDPLPALHVAHVLDRSTKPSIVSTSYFDVNHLAYLLTGDKILALEKAWGTKRVFLDSRFNLFHRKLFFLFDWPIFELQKLNLPGMCYSISFTGLWSRIWKFLRKSKASTKL